jgi:Asp-tRNA(Asn)/Glu-tRNA(Gln) amidotransferase C subunit
MKDLAPEEVKAVAKANGLDVPASDLEPVTNFLNAILEAVESISAPGLELVEPLPVLPFPKEKN